MANYMSQSLCELLSKLKFFSLLEPGKKPCMNSLSFVNSNSYTGSIYRTLTGESANNLILHIEQLVVNISDVVDEYSKSSFMSTIINAINDSLKGIKHLLITYKDRPKVIAKLSVSITNINLYIDKYKHLLNTVNNHIDNHNKKSRSK